MGALEAGGIYVLDGSASTPKRPRTPYFFVPCSAAARSLTSSTTAGSASVVGSTSEPDLSAEDLALGDNNLLEAECAVRYPRPETALELRPIYIGGNVVRPSDAGRRLEGLLVQLTANRARWKHGAVNVHVVAFRIVPDGLAELLAHARDARADAVGA